MANSSKWLRIHVTDLATGESKANVKVPASLANFGMKMAAKYADLDGLDFDQIMEAMKEGNETKLVDVESEEKNEHIEIFVE